MNIREFILKTAKDKGVVRVFDAVKATGFSRTYIHRFFQNLVEEGVIVKVGHTNRTQYVLPNKINEAKGKILAFNRIFKNEHLREDSVFELVKSQTGIFGGISENISRLVEYGFTEMVNNAIEHSGSLKIKVSIIRQENGIRFEVIDWGVGIFEKLIHARHLRSTEEAVQDLLKGKQTTDPEAHTGEGIFFTRRGADIFVIKSSNKRLLFDNLRNDFTVTTVKSLVGTRIVYFISAASARNLGDIFREFTSESFEFSTTEVIVKLYKNGGSKNFISRSQARRILSGLDKFKKIILDFQGVAGVGQGFADEVFRVWKGRYPQIEIMFRNANSDVQFIINHVKFSEGSSLKGV